MNSLMYIEVGAMFKDIHRLILMRFFKSPQLVDKLILDCLSFSTFQGSLADSYRHILSTTESRITYFSSITLMYYFFNIVRNM